MSPVTQLETTVLELLVNRSHECMGHIKERHSDTPEMLLAIMKLMYFFPISSYKITIMILDHSIIYR